MFRDFLLKGFVRALAVFGVLAAVVVVGQTTAAQAYQAPGQTTTELTLEKSTIEPGESNTAYATVTSDTAQPQGTVTFRITGGGGSATIPLVDGQAVWEMPTDDLREGKTYKVIAHYNGVGNSQAMGVETNGIASVIALASSGAEAGFQPSQDVAYLTVASGDVAGDDEEVAAASTGLPGVGQDASTQIAMFAGVGLVAAGLFSLALYRRRVSL